MQVKISYTAEVSDVPQEVSNILNTLTREATDFLDVVEETKTHLEEHELPISKLKMKVLMEKLQKMFARLTDCQVILDGYEKVIDSQPQGQQPTQEQNAKTESQNR